MQIAVVNFLKKQSIFSNDFDLNYESGLKMNAITINFR